MTPTPDSGTTRRHDGMTKRKGLLCTVVGTLVFDGEREPWTHKPARDGRPEMYRSKVDGVELWLKGVKPTKAGQPIVGTIEVKSNEVTQQEGHRGGVDERSHYLYVNVSPLPEGATPTATVAIVRPPKINGTKRLPLGFDPATDFVVNRQGQPWQVITVRDSAAPGVSFAAYEWNKANADAAPTAEAIARVTAELSHDGPAVVVEVNTESDNGFTVIMDATGSEEIAQAIYAERGDDNFPANGAIATWTPEPAPPA